VPLLFPSWADTLLRVGLIGGALAIPGVFVIPIVYVRTPYNLDRLFPVDQPVQFDHRHHVQDDHIACLYCHSGADSTASAGVPATEVCMGCHSQIWPEAPLLEPVRRSFFSGQPLRWARVHEVPDFVYFNHAVHVRRGLECARCHGDVAAMPLAEKTELFTMGWCLDCHRRNQLASLDPPVPLAPDRRPRDARAVGGTFHSVPRIQNCTACHR
jgi:predicted CXXCH cytochrome family protein